MKGLLKQPLAQKLNISNGSQEKSRQFKKKTVKFSAWKNTFGAGCSCSQFKTKILLFFLSNFFLLLEWSFLPRKGRPIFFFFFFVNFPYYAIFLNDEDLPCYGRVVQDVRWQCERRNPGSYSVLKPLKYVLLVKGSRKKSVFLHSRAIKALLSPFEWPGH